MATPSHWIVLVACSISCCAYAQTSPPQVDSYALAVADWRNFAAQTRAARAGPQPESIKGFFATWEAEEGKPGKGRLFQQVTSPKDGREMFAALAWLRSRVLLDRADARYSYAYAFNLFRSHDKTGDYRVEAVHFFLHGQHAGKIDAARCADSPAAVQKILSYDTQLQEIAAFAQKLPPQALFVARVMAIALEDFVGPRDRQEWLCSVAREVPTPPGDMGRTFVLGPSAAEAFIGDPEWHAKREDYLKAQRMQALSGKP